MSPVNLWFMAGSGAKERKGQDPYWKGKLFLVNNGDPPGNIQV